MAEQEQKRLATTVGGIHSFSYCPYCGKEIKRERVPCRWTQSGEPVKYNTMITCPEHGVLYE